MCGLIINEVPQAGCWAPSSDLPSMAIDIPIVYCWVPQRGATTDRMGVQDYLTKPILRSELLDSIGRVVPKAQRILIVDDDDEARQLFGRMLTSAREPYTVIEAENSERALKCMSEDQPDLVLLDLLMPGQDGFAILREKMKDEAIEHIPVIIISAKDRQWEPIVSGALVLTRRQGLSARDLTLSIKAIMGSLPPRYGSPAPLDSVVQSTASE